MLLPFCNKLFLEVQCVHMFFRVVTAITCYTHLLMGFLSDLQQPINVDKLERLRSEVDGFLCRKNLYCSHLLCIIKSTVSSHVVFFVAIILCYLSFSWIWTCCITSYRCLWVYPCLKTFMCAFVSIMLVLRVFCRQTAQILQTTNIRLGSLHRLTELQPASVINGCLICYTLLYWDTAEIK